MTVQGKCLLWDPVNLAPLPNVPTVTVNQTRDLVNQMVHVSWTGFTPSGAQIIPYSATNTDYPVMVAECKGTAPTNPGQCYGATNGGVRRSFDTFGPDNTVFTTTAGDGTGAADIPVLTTRENPDLGCDQNHPCSLVVVPSQGGDPYLTADGSMDCKDHTADTFQSGGATDIGQHGFSALTSDPGIANGLCSWADRIVVPLKFAPAPASCPFRSFSFTAVGSPMLARAMDRWRPGLCTGAASLNVGYDSSVNEPLARDDFLSGSDDVGLTTRPVVGTGIHPYTYAPVAASGVAIAYWVDNPSTAQPITNLKLTPRLVAKLLTTSYSFGGAACQPGQPPSQPTSTSNGCDGSVRGNPNTLFDDPEFQRLNPGVADPIAAGAGYQVPTVLSGNSDMTYEVTRWIAANPDASAFLAGQPDPWGTHVNSAYLGLQYPQDVFSPMDQYLPIAYEYNPVFPPSQAASLYQANNWDPGIQWQLTPNPPGPPVHQKDPIQLQGQRMLFAIVDQADAAAFNFPVAKILNHAGAYVAPTAASMTAAIRDMTTNPDGITRATNETSTDKSAYPLTMVQYAMVPTGGIAKAKAAKIAQFLDFAAGGGQVNGTSPGQLPDGYLPLPASLRAQTIKAANQVRNQTRATPPGGTNHTGGTAAAPGPAASPGSNPAPALAPAANRTLPATPSPGATLPSVGASPTNVSYGNPDSAGMTRIVLPLLLIIGGLLTLAGPSALVLSRPGARAAIAAGIRRMRWRKNP